MKEIIMPKLSDTMTEGTVAVWRKVVGGLVERGEVLAEVETDKATMELEAFASGVLLEIRVPAGKTVPVGTVIGLIGTADERPEVREAAPVKPAPVELKTEQSLLPSSSRAVTHGTAGGTAEVQAAPVVRRRAQELGIDLAAVNGSGPGGRVLLEDLEAAGPRVRSAAGATAPVMPMAPPEPSQGPGLPLAVASPEGEPLSRMRRAIARTVSDSWRTIPHFSVTVEVRMDTAELMRARLKQDGHGVSLTALLVKATAQALGGFPRLNASLQGERLVIHPEVNIGIVVRRDEGLLVPVLRDCAGRPLAEIAQRTGQLVERARNGQLALTELNDGTFAISTLARYEVHSFTALILPPMAAMLAVGSIRDAVIVEAGRPVIGRVLSLTLSADHRIADGVYAAEFLAQLRRLLEDPEKLAE